MSPPSSSDSGSGSDDPSDKTAPPRLIEEHTEVPEIDAGDTAPPRQLEIAEKTIQEAARSPFDDQMGGGVGVMPKPLFAPPADDAPTKVGDVVPSPSGRFALPRDTTDPSGPPDAARAKGMMPPPSANMARIPGRVVEKRTDRQTNPPAGKPAASSSQSDRQTNPPAAKPAASTSQSDRASSPSGSRPPASSSQPDRRSTPPASRSSAGREQDAPAQHPWSTTAPPAREAAPRAEEVETPEPPRALHLPLPGARGSAPSAAADLDPPMKPRGAVRSEQSDRNDRSARKELGARKERSEREPPAVAAAPALLRVAPEPRSQRGLIISIAGIALAVILVFSYSATRHLPKNAAADRARADRSTATSARTLTAHSNSTANPNLVELGAGSGQPQYPDTRPPRVRPEPKPQRRPMPRFRLPPGDGPPARYGFEPVEKHESRKYDIADAPPAGQPPVLVVFTHPTGARVEVDGINCGASPIMLRVPADKEDFEIKVAQLGYQEQTTRVKKNAQGRFEVGVTLVKDPAFKLSDPTGKPKNPEPSPRKK